MNDDQTQKDDNSKDLFGRDKSNTFVSHDTKSKTFENDVEVKKDIINSDFSKENFPDSIKKFNTMYKSNNIEKNVNSLEDDVIKYI